MFRSRMWPFLLLVINLKGADPRQLALQRGVDLGTAVDAQHLSESQYAAVLASQYSQVEPENEMKWRIIHPAPGVYSFAAGDAIVNFAVQHGMKVRGHTLTGDTQLPAWLSDPGLTPSGLQTILEEHITTVVKHYAGRVYAWDVLNEAYADDGTLLPGIWLNTPGIGVPGTGYMELALRWAHAADPAARLFYNDEDDTGLGITPKTDAIYRMAQDFLSRGVPLHGIGMQMHVTAGGVSIPGLVANIKRLTDLGLEVQITEMDVRLPVANLAGASAAELDSQAQVYHDVASACLQFPKCTAIQTWGFTDRYSWIPTAFPGFGDALPLDINYQPKPAWNSIADALASPSTASPANYYRISSGQFLNMGSRSTGAIAPGEMLYFAAPSGPGALVQGSPAAGKYPNSLAGMQVTFDGVPAPLIAAQNGFVIAVAPYEIAAHSSAAVQFDYLGNSSNPISLPVEPAVPGLFTATSTGAGAGLIFDRNFALVSASNPARAGDLIFLSITGEGVSQPAGVTGLSQPYRIFTPLEPLSVTIGGVPAAVAVVWSGPAGLPGMSQIGVYVPPGIPAGNAPVSVRLGGASTQAAVTVALR